MSHMRFKRYFVVLAFVSLISFYFLPYAYAKTSETTDSIDLNDINKIDRVVVFSLDGFRYDYLLRTGDAPALQWFKEQGVTAEYCVPSNPTVTATNHASIITGNPPDKHGILGNTFFDWNDMKTYSQFNQESDPYRDTNRGMHLLTTQPSFIHAEEQGIKTAVFAWPWIYDGDEYQGETPTYIFDGDWFGNDEGPYIRTDEGIATKVADTLIDDPDIGLAFARLPAVDSEGHYSGPDSESIKQVIDGSLDKALQTFFEKLDSAGLLEGTAVILTSDHGMTNIFDNHYILEEKQFYLDAVGNTSIDPYLVYNAAGEYLHFIGETNTSKVEEFSLYLEGQDGIRAVYVNDENNILNLDNPARGINISVWLGAGNSRYFGSEMEGTHGYLNDQRDMRGIFLAAGPGIAQNSTIGGIDIIDIAPTALDLLEIENGFSSEGTILTDIYGARTNAFHFPADCEVPVVETNAVILPLITAIFVVSTIYRLRKKRA
ncbi:MAG: alkaline phosphatase family protein [Candidatus Heimdallarchaeaceae archaeon]